MGKIHLLLYGYGSYGLSIDAAFASPRLSLIDRGFVYAIAHIRGGQELGRQWYEDGKLLKKKNTFTDFIACAEYLIREGFTKPGKLFAMGRSAGGLLMGAVTNMRPDLFRGMVAEVPFVDVITTMLDPSIPLTTGEYDEWGDPNQKEYYDYMLSYSPYDNVEAKSYPSHVDHRGAARFTSPILGARQMGGQTAGAQDGQEPAAFEDEHGRRPRRCFGPFQTTS